MELSALAARGTCFAGIQKPISRTAGSNRLNPKISQVGLPAKVPNRGFCRLVDESATTHQRKTSYLSCSALAELPLGLPDCLDAENSSRCKLQALVSEFKSLVEPLDRVKRLLHYASFLTAMSDLDRVSSNRVMGCTAQVWVSARIDAGGRMRFSADSDSEITRGFCACLVHILDGAFPEEVLRMKTEDLGSLNVGLPGSTNSRANTWHNVLISMQKKTKAILMAREGKPVTEPFPSLVVNADGIRAKGRYAEAQVKFLSPDESKVNELVSVLRAKKIGIVAHFYMDPEVQGVLTAAQKQWPHIHISDSLVMADTAVKMAKSGCEFITVLGVDFMSENVRAILDQAGFGKVGVYRMSDERIGCSLADAAADPAYMNFLVQASRLFPSLHVVYINTALHTKALAHEIVPTITCTSSNVVQTILQAFAQIPDLNIWYGPDSYMGANIVALFHQTTTMTDEEIAHPKHDKSSEGTCIVHGLFEIEVVERIKEGYCDAFLAAHFMEAKRRGMGVVGSTKNILDFITERVKEALHRNVGDHLQFVLGTESGMVTSIVEAVRKLSSSQDSSANIDVEIVFPVSSDSVSRTKPLASSNGPSTGDITSLSVVPGVATGEGCSLHGGCASCPYMKMNSLASLLRVCHLLPDNESFLSPYVASRFDGHTPTGKSVADLGCEPILHMRHFQANGELPQILVNYIVSRR